jgi:tRNA1Val (adenine37-N6)-methyltransferase
VVAVEVQEEPARLALENARILGVAERFEILHANWRDAARLMKPKRFHTVVANPPYRKAKTGKIPPEGSKAIAKHEILGAMPDLIAAAAHLLKPSGRFVAMYPPLRLEEMIRELHAVGFKIQRMSMIHPYPDRPATLAMVEAVRAPGRELSVEGPVIVYRDPDHYTPEIEAWIGPKRRV